MAWEELKQNLINSKYYYFHTNNGVLLCGDCLEVIKLIPKESIDLVIADPPYYKILQEDWDKWWVNKEEYLDWYERWIAKIVRLMNGKSSLYVWCPAVTKKSDISINIYTLLKKYLFFQTWIVWRRQFTHGNSLWLQAQEWCLHFSKSNQIIKNPFKVESDKFEKHSVRCSNVWYIRDVTSQGYLASKEYVGHKAQKPLKAIERIIKGSSNKENLILDPFIGSGTTAIACEKLNRKWIGIEINPEYCEIAKQRIRDYLSNKGA